MQAADVLDRAAKTVETRGLAIGKGRDGEKWCTAVAIFEAAKGGSGELKGKRLEVYLEARRSFVTSLGLADSYQAIVDWNDASRATKEGVRIYYRKPSEVAAALRKAAQQWREQWKTSESVKN